VRFRPVTIAAVAFSAGALCLWGLALSDVRGQSTPAAICAELVGAGTASIIAALCWLVRRQGHRDDVRFARQEAEYRRHVEALIRTAARSGRNPTGPIGRLRAL
jgi:hypothetical protein